MILAGDIGGTKTSLALFEDAPGGLRIQRLQKFESSRYNSLEAIIEEFRAGSSALALHAACFGIAGAIVDGKVHVTNLKWNVSEAALARHLGGNVKVRLINDLSATACGMPHLAPAELAVLNPGRQPRRQGNIGVIAAGTGLGEAVLFWDGQRYHPIATEGGHADFAPRDDREIELLRYLRQRFGAHISYERVISGPGLFNIYEFLRDRGYGEEPSWLRDRLAAGGDSSAIVSEAGLGRQSPLCELAIEMFISLYGAEAGNLALRALTWGGIYVGGGIAPKMLAGLREGPFMHSFTAKGRFAQALAEIQVCVSLNPDTALLGAAHFALTL